MHIILCNDSSQDNQQIDYLITRQGEIIKKREINSSRIYVALQNAGTVTRVGNQWLVVRRINNQMQVVTPHQSVKVPYEFCTLRPWHGWVHYEYYPQRQLKAVADLYHQLKEMHPQLTIFPIHTLDTKRYDPHPQSDMKKLLQQLRHENATKKQN